MAMTDGASLDPSELDQASFELVRRGFDPLPVQRTLQHAAAVIRDLRRERDVLAARVAEVEAVLSEPLEAHRVAEALGAEATQVLEAAHAAAAERAERAKREAEAIRAEALAAADTTRAEAIAAREETLAAAERDAEEVAEEGRQRGRDMVNEAQAVRERMLSDLARKRQTGRAQVEQLRAGRDRLLESLTIAQQSLDAALKDLVDSVPEARAAAERAGLRIANEPTPTVETMEAEIEAARLVGHPLVDGIAAPGSAGDLDDEPDPAFVTAEMEALTHVDKALDPSNEAESAASEDADGDEGVDDEHDEPSGPDDPPPDEATQSEPSEPEVDDPEVDEPAATGDAVDDLFARLRGDRNDDPEVKSEEASQPDAESEPEHEAEQEAAVSADPNQALRARAESVATRALKKVLVEEQSTLLDGVRRSGSDAIAVVVADADAHAAPYESAIDAAFDEIIEAVGGDAGSRQAGYEQLRTVALDPVRSRLLEVAERTDDADELSDTVRGLYRESRSRRLPMAAAAAVSAVIGPAGE
jgi:hypothetical protein